MAKSVEIPVAVGDLLAGKYRVERVLGHGAMGVVVAARHTDLRELRAVKFMLPNALADDTAAERFLREARAVVGLKSQHVARVHDMGRLETGAPYIVMEYLEGRDLRSLLKERGRLPVSEAVRYLVQAAEAIEEAHAAGIVHRDLKPANLFLTTGVKGAACIKVLDFGIAKLVDNEAELTATAELIGTPAYMAPEQMRAKRTVDARADIWAMGVILYKLVTGELPFGGGDITQLCSSVLWDEPDPPSRGRPEVPQGLDAVILRCLQKAPADRFPDVGALVAALSPFTGEQPISLARAGSEPVIAPSAQPSITDGITDSSSPGARTWAVSSSGAPVPKAPEKAPFVKRRGLILAGAFALGFVGIAMGSWLLRTDAAVRPSASVSAATADTAPPPAVASITSGAPVASVTSVASSSAVPIVQPVASAPLMNAGDAGAAPPKLDGGTKPVRKTQGKDDDAFGVSRH